MQARSRRGLEGPRGHVVLSTWNAVYWFVLFVFLSTAGIIVATEHSCGGFRPAPAVTRLDQ